MPNVRSSSPRPQFDRDAIAEIISERLSGAFPLTRGDAYATADLVAAALAPAPVAHDGEPSAHRVLAAALHQAECGCGNPTDVSDDLADAAIAAFRSMTPTQRAELDGGA